MARKVAEAIGVEECLLAGGLAVIAHGFVRGTRDVDLLARLPLSEAKRRLERGGLPTRSVKGDVLEGGFPCLKGVCDGLPFDVLPQIVPIHWEAAVPVAASGAGSLPRPARVVARRSAGTRASPGGARARDRALPGVSRRSPARQESVDTALTA